MKERITYFDILRGFAIIGVVAIHSTAIGYQFDDSSFQFIGTVVWRQMLNFSVPLFLAISGYFLAEKKVENRGGYFSFIQKQIPRVLIPYLIWSLLYLGFDLTRGVELKWIIFKLLTFQTAVPFYFIALIIQYYLFLPVMQRLATVKGLFFSAMISFFSCSLIFYFRYFTDFTVPLYIYAAGFPTWIVFFVLGIYLKTRRIEIKKGLLGLLIIIGSVLSLVETYFLYTRFQIIQQSATAVKVSSFLYAIAVILFLFKNVENRFKHSKLLIFIGEISFGIYLSHMFFLYNIKLYLDNIFPLLNSYAMLKQVTLICLTICCRVLFALIARALNKRIAIRYLGQ